MEGKMEISMEGLEAIEGYEELRLSPYKDQGGRFTIGWGHRMDTKEIADLVPGGTITAEDAADLLKADVEDAVNCVNEVCTVNLTQNQFDALVSFTFNVGCENFELSTLLELLNEGNTQGAAAQFTIWDHVNGKVSDGLLKRRMEEQKTFLTQDV